MVPTDSKSEPKFDVYARPFIPLSLKSVNEAPANVVSSAPVRWIDFQRYVHSFAGTTFLTGGKLPPIQETRFEHGSSNKLTETLVSLRASAGTDTPPAEFNPQTYQSYLGHALEQEAMALRQQCDDHALYQVPLTKNGAADPRPSMYTLQVPGLREVSLRIEVGDIVQLRQLRFNSNGGVVSGSLIKDANGRPVKLPRHADFQYDGVVWGIDRLRETLSLRVDSLAPEKALLSHQSWVRSMLFPEEADGYYQKTLNKSKSNLELYDELLNYEQGRAVSTVLNETYGPVPFIISGPPGTGKTKTLVELTLQLLAKSPAAHLLVCAPSDPAADTLIQRLSKHLKPSSLLRVNAPSRSFPEVPNNVLPFCFVDDGMFSLPPMQDLLLRKVVVTTCRDVDTLLRARLSNKDLFALEQKLFVAIHPHESHLKPKLHWTGLLIDEAAQATEPEALLPLSFVAPPLEHDVEEQWPIFVLAGDQHQLGSRTASKSTAIQTSLFERLLDRSFYRDHPLARSKQRGGVIRPLTQQMLPILRPAFANLIRNYRSHPSILAVPSSLFYNDTLEPEAPATDSLIHWPGWKRNWPVLFASNTSPDEIERDGGGWYNIDEASMACKFAESFVGKGRLQPHEVCIMSPFQAQVRVLRKFAREHSYEMRGVNIGPLEAFQGLESRLVILCTTRTRTRFIDQDIGKGLGVIHEPRRFNVALTRAKEGLIVIGNPEVLSIDRNWRAFIAFCHRNGLCDGLNDGLPGAESAEDISVSRLERQLLVREEASRNNDTSSEILSLSNGVRKLGHADSPEDAIWKSGVAAEQLVMNDGIISAG